MKKYLIILGVLAVVAISGVVWLYATPPAAPISLAPTPTIGATTAAPTVIAVDTPTTITLTSVITDPTVIPTGVNLLRINPTGNPTILGRLRDDGTGGDAVAGDKKFTAQITFNESATGEIRLQVSAAFRGMLKRVTSAVFVLPVWNTYISQSFGLSFSHPAMWIPIEVPSRVYFMVDDIEVLDISIPSPPNLELFQFAQFEINNNDCPAIDSNGNPVDHIIDTNSSSSVAGILYVLSCSATTDDYVYAFLNNDGKLIKIKYHDDFDVSAPETKKTATFQRMISTLRLQ
jgi:hypothetical protein